MISDVQNISAPEAWKILIEDNESILVDVRSESEWSSDEIADLSKFNKEPLYVSWRLYPENVINKDFLNYLTQKVPNKKIKLLFICRSGGRSLEAAHYALENGYFSCFNVLNGFQGRHLDKDSHFGWKQFNLPYRSIKND